MRGLARRHKIVQQAIGTVPFNLRVQAAAVAAQGNPLLPGQARTGRASPF
jgi:hypothetical protein